NIKILNSKTAFINNVFEVTPFNSEILPINIAGYIKQNNEIKIEEVKIEPIITPTKIVVPVKKVKVEVEEGGC
ncbi:MAG: hypothetical protein Q7U08_04230, partial [Flavobacteriaceae bacterium]|nr:hypothetical protein [Flavobacteriaceae bacterium]